MMRAGDEQHAQTLRDWYENRQTAVAVEILDYLPCAEGTVRCPDDSCQADQDICELPIHSCSQPQVWCSSSERCIDGRFDFCYPCPADAPLYCVPTGVCVADRETCADAACVGDDRYCPAISRCFSPSAGETCPVGACDDDQPFSCPLLGACVADEAACAAACTNPDAPYCPTDGLCKAAAACAQPCPPDVPYRCAVDQTCVINEGACAALCPAETPWCPGFGACVDPLVCRFR
jgi:hypothetical protein